MINCTKEIDGTFSLSGLTAEQLLEIEDGLVEQFNRTNKKIHSSYRRQLLEIYRPISTALDLHDRQKACYMPTLNL